MEAALKIAANLFPLPLCLLLAACGPAVQAPAGEPPAGQAPTRGGMVYLAVPSGPETVDPYLTVGGGAVTSLQRLVYDGLLDYKQDRKSVV